MPRPPPPIELPLTMPPISNPVKKRHRVIDDSDCDAVVPLDGTAVLTVDAPVMVMNKYFNQFTGCRNCILQPPLPDAAPEATVMDLRAAVPKETCQYLDLESKHMPIDSDDSSGQTGESGSDSCSSFISDSRIDEVSTDELAWVEKYLAKALPATAAQLRQSHLKRALSSTAASAASAAEAEASSSPLLSPLAASLTPPHV